MVDTACMRVDMFEQIEPAEGWRDRYQFASSPSTGHGDNSDHASIGRTDASAEAEHAQPATRLSRVLACRERAAKAFLREASGV
jgi:hypothetical protein